jgi:uncharacterized RDD family membrane protein YckC
MDSDSTILDSENLITEFDPRDYMASAGKRFANYLLDTVIFYVLAVILIVVIAVFGVNIAEEEVLLQVISILLYFLYFLIFETALGKTPAKFITRTRVVNDEGNLPNPYLIAGRSLSRFVPFDVFSFLGNYARGWHDRWSNTWVIDEKKVDLMRASKSGLFPR